MPQPGSILLSRDNPSGLASVVKQSCGLENTINSVFVNLATYPIDRPDSPDYQSLVTTQAKLLTVDGMINLPGFLTAEGVQQYQQEIHDRMDIAFHAVSERHPYGYSPSDRFPEDHPRNTFCPTESYRLARHHMPATELDQLYCWPPMRRFIADITGNQTIYLSGDPSNGLVVQVYREGCGQAWHFDQALFSTILNLSESEAGGVFECVPDLRTEEDPKYDDVESVLEGRSERIQKHNAKAGSFTIMRGRYAMHRVTTIQKEKPRISVVLSYELEPNVYMDLETRKISFGPTAPELPA